MKTMLVEQIKSLRRVQNILIIICIIQSCSMLRLCKIIREINNQISIFGGIVGNIIGFNQGVIDLLKQLILSLQ